MSEVTGQQLLGEGRPITLKDGESVWLRFECRSMLKIEELFGSYDAFQDQMRSGTAGPLFHAVLKGIWAALQHDEKWRGNARYWDLIDRLDQAYVIDEGQSILLDAIAEAFPPRQAQEAEEPTNPATPETQPFPGQPFTHLLDDISDSVTTSSGR